MHYKDEKYYIGLETKVTLFRDALVEIAEPIATDRINKCEREGQSLARIYEDIAQEALHDSGDLPSN